MESAFENAEHSHYHHQLRIGVFYKALMTLSLFRNHYRCRLYPNEAAISLVRIRLRLAMRLIAQNSPYTTTEFRWYRYSRTLEASFHPRTRDKYGIDWVDIAQHV